jgi:ornithine cyclodeaminase/alanine dehydrogenase-like protein (mu-crystallin family)
MKQYTAQQIENILPVHKIVEAVKSGIVKYQKGQYQVPTRMHLEQTGLTYLLMPAIGKKYFCTKLVAVVPENPRRQLPYVVGTVVLHRRDTGEAIAIMDAPMITALRTGAVGAIGLELISPSNTESLGVIGCGVQGIWQSIFATSVRPVKEVYCYSRTAKRFEEYREKVLEKCPKLKLHLCESPEEVIRQSQAIYTCTTSSTPVFKNDARLIEGKHFISVGSFRKDMQELPDVVYQQSSTLLIDSPAAREEVGDVINALNNELLMEEDILDLGEILLEPSKLHQPESTVFKSVGMAAFDLALAEAIMINSQA